MRKKNQYFSVVLGLLLLGTMHTPVWATEVSVLGLFNNRALVSINGGQQKVLKVGVETPEGVRLVSTDSKGNQAVLVIDGVEQTVAMGRATNPQGFAKPQRAKQVQIVKNNIGMYSTIGSINGRNVKFLVDTGASQVAMNVNEAKRLGIPFRLIGQKIQVETASGIAKAYAVKLKSVQVGGIKLINVSGVVIESTSPKEVLLGMSFLSQLQMIHEGNLLIIKKKY